MVAVLALLLVAVGASAALTFVGQRKRGRGWGTATVAGVLFPLAWAIWYVRDEQPYRGPVTPEP